MWMDTIDISILENSLLLQVTPAYNEGDLYGNSQSWASQELYPFVFSKLSIFIKVSNPSLASVGSSAI